MRCFAMTHADTLALPPHALESKTAFYAHVVEVLVSLLSPSPAPTVDHVAGNWVTSLSNCSRCVLLREERGLLRLLGGKLMDSTRRAACSQGATRTSNSSLAGRMASA